MRQIEARALKANFTAAIAQNAGKNVDVPITGAIGGAFGATRCRIKGIVIVAEENLDWEVWLWTSATHPSNRDADPWVGFWRFAAADAVTESGDPSTSYRYFLSNLDVPYVDDDTETAGTSQKQQNGSIHMTLIPRGAAHVINKEIVIKFFCEPEVGWA